VRASDANELLDARRASSSFRQRPRLKMKRSCKDMVSAGRKFTNPEGYKDYVAANQAAFRQYAARYVIRAGRYRPWRAPVALELW